MIDTKKQQQLEANGWESISVQDLLGLSNSEMIDIENKVKESIIIMQKTAKLLTALADIQHAIWAHWMTYLFTQGTFTDNGSFTIPTKSVQRWQRQSKTVYSELTPKEQASDIQQAQKIISVLYDYFGTLL